MTAPHFDTEHVTVWHGDCIDVMRGLPDASVDAVVTDPPYGLGFMGHKWDTYTAETGRAKSEKHSFDHVGGNHNPVNSADQARTRRAEGHKFEAWCEEWALEAYRLLKPGGHLLAFGGTRTFHRLAAGIEDAGFEIRDSIAWLYGSGFPKSLDVSKAIDKAAGAEREIVGRRNVDTNWRGKESPDSDRYADTDANVNGGDMQVLRGTRVVDVTAPATPDAARWQGWGTALKPAFEPIVVARKPLTGTVAANVLQHGTGALNIDASRIAATDPAAYAAKGASVVGLDSNRTGDAYGEWTGKRTDSTSQLGRWPSNVILDEHTAPLLDAQSGTRRSAGNYPSDASTTGLFGDRKQGQLYDDQGGASRFFYTAKASTDERPSVDGIAHPTVKPVDLMRWLVKLVTPKGGTILEPFAGSGTTVEAAVLEGFRCIAIEREADYLPLIMQRVSKPHAVGLDFGDWEDAS